jgi:dTDP-4-dehydrorhamnose 3,5-epimerase
MSVLRYNPRVMDLPHGIRFHDLTGHRDQRGVFTEVFREEWGLGIHPVQWNVVSSTARVLRGVHVHLAHADYLVVVSGRAEIGLFDLRESSPTFEHPALLRVEGGARSGLFIPAGVAHGFYFFEPSVHLYAVSRYWDPEDELGCLWADPELRLPWSDPEPIVSERDAGLPGLPALREEIAERRRALEALRSR